jgi:hypothetical protein
MPRLCAHMGPCLPRTVQGTQSKGRGVGVFINTL